MADIDDVPPLEDMSELLKQVKTLGHESKPSVCEELKNTPSKKKKSSTMSEQVVMDPAQVEREHQQRAANKAKKKAQASGFGGLKKGFLFGGPTVSKSKPVAAKVKDDMPMVKPKQTKEDERRIPEVQKAMMGEFLDKKKDSWLTEDLLHKVQKNDDLVKKMADPSFIAAVAEFQTNPAAAAEKFKGNPEMEKFFREFSGVMADHMSKLGETSPTPAAAAAAATPAIQTEDERHMQQILADPEVRDIFNDPRVQKLFSSLRTDPASTQRLIREADPVLQKRLRKLVEAGLLQVAR